MDPPAPAPAPAPAPTLPAATSGVPPGAKKPPTGIDKARAAVQKLPDPTLLFLFLCATVLGLASVRPAWLTTWIARLTLAPALLASVAAAFLWRRTTAHHATPADRRDPPAGVIPNGPALVARGASLRERDRAVARDEEKLRKAQVRLEVLRKEIESRLPSHNSIASLVGGAEGDGGKVEGIERPPLPTPPRGQGATGARRVQSVRGAKSFGSLR